MMMSYSGVVDLPLIRRSDGGSNYMRWKNHTVKRLAELFPSVCQEFLEIAPVDEGYPQMPLLDESIGTVLMALSSMEEARKKKDLRVSMASVLLGPAFISPECLISIEADGRYVHGQETAFTIHTIIKDILHQYPGPKGVQRLKAHVDMLSMRQGMTRLDVFIVLFKEQRDICVDLNCTLTVGDLRDWFILALNGDVFERYKELYLRDPTTCPDTLNGLFLDVSAYYVIRCDTVPAMRNVLKDSSGLVVCAININEKKVIDDSDLPVISAQCIQVPNPRTIYRPKRGRGAARGRNLSRQTLGRIPIDLGSVVCRDSEEIIIKTVFPLPTLGADDTSRAAITGEILGVVILEADPPYPCLIDDIPEADSYPSLIDNGADAEDAVADCSSYSVCDKEKVSGVLSAAVVQRDVELYSWIMRCRDDIMAIVSYVLCRMKKSGAHARLNNFVERSHVIIQFSIAPFIEYDWTEAIDWVGRSAVKIAVFVDWLRLLFSPSVKEPRLPHIAWMSIFLWLMGIIFWRVDVIPEADPYPSLIDGVADAEDAEAGCSSYSAYTGMRLDYGWLTFMSLGMIFESIDLMQRYLAVNDDVRRMVPNDMRPVCKAKGSDVLPAAVGQWAGELCSRIMMCKHEILAIVSYVLCRTKKRGAHARIHKFVERSHSIQFSFVPSIELDLTEEICWVERPALRMAIFVDGLRRLFSPLALLVCAFSLTVKLLLTEFTYIHRLRSNSLIFDWIVNEPVSDDECTSTGRWADQTLPMNLSREDSSQPSKERIAVGLEYANASRHPARVIVKEVQCMATYWSYFERRLLLGHRAIVFGRRKLWRTDSQSMLDTADEMIKLVPSKEESVFTQWLLIHTDLACLVWDRRT